MEGEGGCHLNMEKWKVVSGRATNGAERNHVRVPPMLEAGRSVSSWR